jgi:hypothetical protein
MEKEYRIIWTYDIKWNLEGNEIENCYSNDGVNLDFLNYILIFKVCIDSSYSESQIQDILSDQIYLTSGWDHNGFSYDEFNDVFELVEEVGIEDEVMGHYKKVFNHEYPFGLSKMNPEFVEDYCGIIRINKV